MPYRQSCARATATGREQSTGCARRVSPPARCSSESEITSLRNLTRKKNRKVEKPKYSVHLFAGGGGGILADLLEGITPVCAVEIMEYQRTVLGLRFPGLPIWDDVRTFRADNPECAGMFADLREHRDEIVIAGGFPCQDVSCAGKGTGLRGARSGLWTEGEEVSFILRKVPISYSRNVFSAMPMQRLL